MKKRKNENEKEKKQHKEQYYQLTNDPLKNKW